MKVEKLQTGMGSLYERLLLFSQSYRYITRIYTGKQEKNKFQSQFLDKLWKSLGRKYAFRINKT